jgi:hypothetical protein
MAGSLSELFFTADKADLVDFCPASGGVCPYDLEKRRLYLFNPNNQL